MMRAGTERDAILGIVPREVHQPSSREEAEALLRRLHREKMRAVFVGGGTAIGLGAPPAALDAVIRTEGLARVAEYAPSDQVVTVEAGMTLALLQRMLGESGQRLALDPPEPERATIGGIVAAGSFGPRRARYGGVRDLIIGVTLVRSDGVRARGGGKVVKNVAGFDLPKLMCGSLGTLGLIETVTFRVHPLPEQEVTLLLSGRSAAGVHEAVRALVGAQLEPTSAVAIRNHEGSYDVLIRFEGFGAGVQAQAARSAELLPIEALNSEAARGRWALHDAIRSSGELRPVGAVSSDSAKASAVLPESKRSSGELWPVGTVSSDSARASAVLPDSIRSSGELALKIAVLPNALGALDAAIRPLLEALPDAGFVLYPTLGFGFLTTRAGVAIDERAAPPIAAARRAVIALGGSLVIERAPLSLRAQIDPWGPAPAAIRLHRAVKQRFDPDALLAPGRFVGGI